ncbi:MAG: adenosylmethionine decarboxylase [Parcubacteria group bacterium]|nr:adenosylmethionine decarboxylase [Parcubacteria group bacterium]
MNRKKTVSKSNYKVYGKHLMIDARGIERKKLENHKIVFDFLNDLPQKIGMRKLTIPYVVFCEEADKKGDWGLSGFVMIYESHISAHTWPELGYVSMDVYSCRDFDDKKTVRLIKQHWGCKTIKASVVRRG